MMRMPEGSSAVPCGCCPFSYVSPSQPGEQHHQFMHSDECTRRECSHAFMMGSCATRRLRYYDMTQDTVAPSYCPLYPCDLDLAHISHRIPINLSSTAGLGAGAAAVTRENSQMQ